MDEIMDTKVVQMKFDNSQFRAGVEDTIRQLDALENSLEMQGASKGLDNVAKASKETSKAMNLMGESVESVHVAFSYLEVAGITAMVRLTNAALSYGKKIANNLWSKSIGQIISGGKRRSQNISNAKFQLEGLGVAWDDIVDDINYGVKDTAYGLDEAATAASQLVASQVQLGQEMKNALRGISGTAAMTNSSFSEIANIWTTVASNGKLMTMQLRQLSARGLNASAVLAKAMGTTEAAINDMVTKGQIDFKTFAEAMDNAFGEHAKEANKTFQGALSNMNAALSRIGQKFADPVFESLRKVFIALTDDIDAINKALQPAMDAFSTILGDAERVTDKFLKNEHFVKGLIALAVDFWTWVRTVLSAIQEFSGAGVYIDNVTIPFENLAKALQLYGDKAEYAKNIIKDVISFFDILVHGVKDALEILRPIGEALLSGIGIPLEKIKEMLKPGWLYDNKEAIKSIMDIIANFIAMKLSDVIHAIGQAIRSIDWKAVLQAVVIIVNVVSKAILLLPQLIRIVNTIFKSVVIAVGIAIAAVLKFIELVTTGFNYVRDMFGLGISRLFGVTYTPTFEVHADTSQAQESIRNVQREANETTWNDANVQTWEDVSETTDNATESVNEYNDAISETSDRMEVADKNFRRQSEDVVKGYDDMAKSAEDASDRMSAASKGAGPFDPRPAPPPRTSDSKQEHGHDVRDVMKEKPDITGQNGFLGSVNSWFDRLEKDTTQQDKATSALNIWFGGVADTVKEVAGSWFTKLSGIIAAVQPILFVIGGIALAATKVIAPILIVGFVIKVVYEVTDTLLSNLKAFGNLAEAALEYGKANKYRALADVFRALASAVVAIAISVGVIALAALVIKQNNLGEIVGEIFGQIYGIMRFVMVMTIFISIATSITSLMGNATRVLSLLNSLVTPGSELNKKTVELRSNLTTVLKSFAALFLSIAVEFAVLAGAIKVLGSMPIDQFYQGLGSFLLITGLLMTMIWMMGFFASRFNSVNAEIRQITGKGGLLKTIKQAFGGEGEGSFTHQIEKSGNVMYLAILAMAGFFALITASVAIFGNMDEDQLFRGMLVILAAMLAINIFVNSTFSSLEKLTKDMSGFYGINSKDFGNAMSRIMYSLVGMIASMSLVVGSISLVMRSVKDLDMTQILSAGGTIAASLIMLTIFINVVSKAASSMSGAKMNPAYLANISVIVGSLAMFVSTLAVSLSLMKNIPFGQLMGEMLALTLGLTAIGAFVVLLPKILTKLMGKEFDVGIYANFLKSLSVSMSILMGSIAATLWALSKVNWSDMEGSGGYLIGTAVFIGILVVLVGVLAKLANGNTKAILAASLGTFAGISLLLFSISNMFTTLDAVDLGKINSYWPLLAGVAVFIDLTMGIAGLLAIKKDIAVGATLVIMSMSVMFFALGSMFVMVGMCADLIGNGAVKIANAIETLIMIDWHRTNDAVTGIKNLLTGVASMGTYLDWDMIGGASKLSLFSLLVAFAIRTLSGVDPAAAKDSATAITQFLTTLAEGLEGKEQILSLLTALSTVLPMLAIGITMSMIGLAIGGLGLVAFAYEMIIFTQLMQQVSESIGPVVSNIVTAISECGDAIFMNSDKLLTGMLALSAFGVLLAVTGALLLVGGAVMAAASGLILLSGSILAKGITALITAIDTSSNAILMSSDKLLIGLGVLSAFAVLMIVTGTLLTVGSGLFAVASVLLLVSSLAISGGLVVLGKAGVSFSKSTVHIVNNFRMMVANLKALALESASLGPAFAQAAVYTVAGFIEGIAEGLPLIAEAMSTLGMTALKAFLITLGIHSPATEMIKAAYYTVEGFIEGLVENAPSLNEVCTDIVEGVINIFSGGSEEIAGEGADAAAEFGLNFESVMDSICPDMSEMMHDIGSVLGDNYGLGLEEGLKRHIENMIAYEQELASHVGPANWTPGQYSQYLREVQRGANYNEIQAMVNEFNAQAENRARHEGLLGQIPTYTPLSTLGIDTGYIDVDEIYGNLGGGAGGGAGLDTTSAMASAISGSSGAGSGINDQSKAASIGGGVGNTITNSNNTYNFVQNNYSPEALDRSEIYQQTRSQLNSFYGFMREKNPAF